MGNEFHRVHAWKKYIHLTPTKKNISYTHLYNFECYAIHNIAPFNNDIGMHIAFKCTLVGQIFLALVGKLLRYASCMYLYLYVQGVEMKIVKY